MLGGKKEFLPLVDIDNPKNKKNYRSVGKMGMKLNKKEAIAMFRESHADFLKEHRGDRIAKATAWNDFTDMLCKDGQITLRQYETWVNIY